MKLHLIEFLQGLIEAPCKKVVSNFTSKIEMQSLHSILP